MMSSRIGGLYAITPDNVDTENLLIMVRDVLVGGAKLIQYRNKTADIDLRRKQVHQLLCLCREYGVPLIVNDHLDLALETDADGVHLGQKDVSVSQARRVLGSKKIVGASCYNQIELAVKAEAQGADYVAFGAFFISATKPNAVSVPLKLLTLATHKLQVPIVVIGGIMLTNAYELIQRGGNAIAVCKALFDATDIQSTAKSFSELFSQVST